MKAEEVSTTRFDQSVHSLIRTVTVQYSEGQWTVGIEADLPLLYSSDNLVVVNKRYDLKVNSDDPADTVTVATILNRQLSGLADGFARHGFRFVHRLDYATSGCLCIALNKKGARWGNKAFAKRYVTKYYLALVRGHLEVDAGNKIEIDIAIGNDTSVTDVHRMCTADSPDCKDPRDAQTRIVLLEHGTYDGQSASKVLLVPHTGRTHQLRVHCRHIGHSVVGDYMYSDRTDTKPYRMMLHALHLIIPMKYEHIDVIAPDPFLPDLDPLWEPTNVFSNYQTYVEQNKREHSKQSNAPSS